MCVLDVLKGNTFFQTQHYTRRFQIVKNSAIAVLGYNHSHLIAHFASFPFLQQILI